MRAVTDETDHIVNTQSHSLSSFILSFSLYVLGLDLEKHSAAKVQHVTLRERGSATLAEVIGQFAHKYAAIDPVALAWRVGNDFEAPFARVERHERFFVARLVAEIAKQGLIMMIMMMMVVVVEVVVAVVVAAAAWWQIRK